MAEKNLAMRERLRALARAGRTQAEIAREFDVSHTRIQELAREMGITFRRKAPKLVMLICPECGDKREMPESKAKARVTAYCKTHYPRRKR